MVYELIKIKTLWTFSAVQNGNGITLQEPPQGLLGDKSIIETTMC